MPKRETKRLCVKVSVEEWNKFHQKAYKQNGMDEQGLPKKGYVQRTMHKMISDYIDQEDMNLDISENRDTNLTQDEIDVLLDENQLILDECESNRVSCLPDKYYKNKKNIRAYFSSQGL